MRHIINQLMFPVWVTRSHSEAADLMKTKVLIYQYINISIYQCINISRDSLLDRRHVVANNVIKLFVT